MSTKAEIAEELNDKLDFISKEISWEKLPKEDLIVLKEKFADPKKLVRELVAERGEEVLDSAIMKLDETLEDAGGDELGKGRLLKRAKDRLLG